MSDSPVQSISAADAAGIWAAAKQRLETVRGTYKSVEQELEAADRDERQAWKVLQRLAGRGEPEPEPPTYAAGGVPRRIG